ncbi:fimbria/pilus periplasmic chaperone [Burkholderia sp. BCC0322]|uniref:fimbria/pilus periplasmic chaperone n=1 Tax=unclassified Burkholderia TaxID=2613784 RepID=UPI00158A3C88|nr:fimbria/pilus periplasmic chaperone [Burkholderia sp. BCC0322]
MKVSRVAYAVIACSIMSMAAAKASVVVTGTRFIYPENEREVTIRLNNVGERPALVQTWVDNGDSGIDSQKHAMPFTVTPPVFRIDPGKGQTLRLAHTKEPLPTDRESLYWLNVLEIPSDAKKAKGDQSNALHLAMRSRLKIFYRPSALKGEANDAPNSVTWSFALTNDGKQVLAKANNPTPYHINVAHVTVKVAGKTHQSDGEVIAPFSSREFVFKDLREVPAANTPVHYDVVNDFGAALPVVYPSSTK